MRQWRVGTVSMGIMLIAFGIILLGGQLWGFQSIEFILKWWPIVLIVLGIEILGFVYFSKEEKPKIKYDGFSIFFMILIMIISFGIYAGTTVLSKVTNGKDVSSFIDLGISKYDSVYNKKMTLRAEGKNKFIVNNIYGNVKIEKSISKDIEVSAKIRIKNNDEKYAKTISDKIIFQESTGSNEIKLSTQSEQYLSNRDKLKEINVDYIIKVPAGIAIESENKYGDTNIAGITKAVKIINSNGNVESKSIGGDLYIENSYGNVQVNSITGKTEIKTKNGHVKASGIGKTLKVKNEYGDIFVYDVKGDTDIFSINGNIDIKKLGTNLKINAKYSTVKVEEIIGNIDVKSNNDNMDLKNIGGNVNAQNSYGDINLSEADKLVNLTSKDGNIKFETSKIITNNVTIYSEYADIKVLIPTHQGGIINAYTEYGDIENNLNLSVNEKSNKKSVRQTIGNGKINFTLKDKNGNIQIKSIK